MQFLIKQIEKMKPFFEKISRNSYLRAIRDGFISLIPVIIFSSIFMLIAYVPNIWGFHWSGDVESNLMKAYNYSMGILAVLMAMTISKSLTDTFNGKLPATRQINTTSVMIASISAFLLLSADQIDGGISSGYLGSTGLLTSFVIGFTVPNIYKMFIKNNITIKMPKEVPQNISQTFADMFPLAASVLFFWLFDMIFRVLANTSFSAWIIEFFQPLFTAADGYIGLTIIFGAIAFFWFLGIHGPSIVEPAVAAIYIANVEANLFMYQNGEHASNILSQGAQYFVVTFGGTGATLMITYMIAFMAKSKQLKAIGKASAVPVTFGVNEPALFGIPIVLNPVFFIPFIFAPILNIWIFKFFVDSLGMNSFLYNLPWTTPGPLGIVLGTGIAPLSFLLVIVLMVVDFLIYYPFMKVYDKELIEKEKLEEDIEGNVEEVNEEEPETLANTKLDKPTNVLVLCAGGATSSMLANAIDEGAKERELEIETFAMAYGQHKNDIDNYDLIILAPQISSMLGELEEDTGQRGVKSVSTNGKEYVDLSKDPAAAVNFALKNINQSEDKIHT
ncbi:PTS transporter subunit EIIC [Lentibacillus salinarum]|uniref:PTS system lactose-specific EIICB component n=1 Tax=Lentibacillus salinarum TaxID=446820 RepID=A0ABW3ZVD8_9BACI